MMIHVLSGTWPLPREPTQVNPNTPNDPDDLIAVSEFDRRKESVEMIKQDHPLLPLIKCCVSNGSSHRPTSSYVLQRVNETANKYYTTSFTNKVEMLQWIKTLETEIEDLHSQMDKFKAELQHQEEVDTLKQRLRVYQGQLEKELESKDAMLASTIDENNHLEVITRGSIDSKKTTEAKPSKKERKSTPPSRDAKKGADDDAKPARVHKKGKDHYSNLS